MRRIFLMSIILGLTVVFPAARAMAVGTVSGTVTYDGAPVAGIAVTFCAPGGGLCSQHTTDGSGVFTITNVTAGTGYLLYTASQGYHPMTFFPHAFSKENAELITVTDGATTTCDISQLPGGIISGKVTINGANAQAFVICRGVDDGITTSIAERRSTKSTGIYTMRPVVPGPYICYGLDTANEITVTANQTTENVNFNLNAGGAVIPLIGN